MNVVFLGVLAEHPISSILLDVLMLLSLLGAAMLMLSALLGSNSSSAQKRARVELILVPVTRVRQRRRALLRPWEVPCAPGGATRAPPGPSPIRQAPFSSSQPVESDQS